MWTVNRFIDHLHIATTNNYSTLRITVMITFKWLADRCLAMSYNIRPSAAFTYCRVLISVIQK